MPEVTYIGLGPLLAKGRAALATFIQCDEDLVARQQERAPEDTGTLRAGIHIESITAEGNTIEAINSTGGESAEYAELVHTGTAAHIIEAHDGGYLDWPGADHPVKKVHHPGTAPNPYMTEPLIENIGLYQRAMADAAAEEF